MYSLRTVLMALLVLSISASWLVAEEPQPGKLRLVHWFKKLDENVSDYAFATDGRLLMVGSNRDGSNYVGVWDPKLGKEIARCSLGKELAYNITVSLDGKTVACSYNLAQEICVFDVASGKIIARIAQPDQVRGARFTPDAKSLITLSDGYRLWDVKTGKELWRLRLRFPDKLPLPLNERGGLDYWETHSRLAFSPDGKTLAVGLEDSSVHLCDMAKGVQIRRLFRSMTWGGVPSLAFSPDGRYLASHTFEGFPGEAGRLPLLRLVIRLWDVTTGELVRELKQPIPPIRVDRESRMAILMMEKLERLRFLRKYDRDSWGLAFSPDGKTLLNCCMWVTQLWEVASGQLRHEFVPNTSNGCFSPDGRVLATRCMAMNSDGVSWDGIHLWDWRDPCLKQPKRLAPRDIDQLGVELASPDASLGFRAMATLLAHPQAAVMALKERLRRVAPVAPGEMDRLIANLDDDEFAVRERACERLVALGEAARPSLLRVKAARPSLEVRRRIDDLLPHLSPAGLPDRLRCLRAVEVLESIDTEEARHVLNKLASGADGSVETEDAKAALNRVKRK